MTKKNKTYTIELVPDELRDNSPKCFVFVYGTLMRNHRNNSYLSEGNFVCEGTIEGYDMYELGGYPGIVDGTGKVSGEVYCIPARIIAYLDKLEAEGCLYDRKVVAVKCNGEQTVDAYVYVYKQSVSGNKLLYGRYGSSQDYVWYVSYGSNMMLERLRCYIQGGTCRYNNKSYNGCTDKSMPIRDVPVTIPYDMFYSNYGIGAWKNSAVSFLDCTRAGFAYGRAYLITREQLNEIHRAEGKSKNWYPEVIRLDDIEGREAYTFGTYEKKRKEEYTKVSAVYGYVLFQGLKETYPDISDEEIFGYLSDCGVDKE